MRNAFLYSLPAAIIAVAGCGSQPREQAARSDLQRDLTLATHLTDSAVVSPVELGEFQAQAGNIISQASHRVARHRAVRHPNPVVAKTNQVGRANAPATAPAPVATVSQPASVADVPLDSHELLPGKTVTVIPVSSGPSTGSGAARGPDDLPVMAGTGGSGMGGGGSGMGGSGMGGGGSGMGGSGMGGGQCPGRGPGVGIASRPRGLLY